MTNVANTDVYANIRTRWRRGLHVHNGIELIDHPVIAARDLDTARVAFEKLGFTVPPRGSHIEWGTGNLCIMFPDDYLEVRGIIDASRFTMHLDEHLDAFGEGLMGVAFGTRDIVSSHREMQQHGIDTGDIRSLTRNFEHPEGWTQPSFRLCAPAATDIEGLMHVVVIEHLTPELIRRPEFLDHANSCTGVAAMSGVIYDAQRVAAKMRALLGSDSVSEDSDGVRVRLANGQALDLLLPAAYERRYGDIAGSPEPDTPRLGTMTLRVESMDALRRALDSSSIPYSGDDSITCRCELCLRCIAAVHGVGDRLTPRSKAMESPFSSDRISEMPRSLWAAVTPGCRVVSAAAGAAHVRRRHHRRRIHGTVCGTAPGGGRCQRWCGRGLESRLGSLGAK